MAHVAHVRGEIIDVLSEWLTSGGGSQDILDDSALYRAVKTFLESSSDHTIPESPHRDDTEVVESWKGLKSRILGFSTLFTSQTLRPNNSKTHALEHKTTLSGSLNFVDLPDIDRMKPEELVNHINAMATAAYHNVTEDVGNSVVAFINLLNIFAGSLHHRGPFGDAECRSNRLVPAAGREFCK